MGEKKSIESVGIGFSCEKASHFVFSPGLMLSSEKVKFPDEMGKNETFRNVLTVYKKSLPTQLVHWQ